MLQRLSLDTPPPYDTAAFARIWLPIWEEQALELLWYDLRPKGASTLQKDMFLRRKAEMLAFKYNTSCCSNSNVFLPMW